MNIHSYAIKVRNKNISTRVMDNMIIHFCRLFLMVTTSNGPLFSKYRLGCSNVVGKQRNGSTVDVIYFGVVSCPSFLAHFLLNLNFDLKLLAASLYHIDVNRFHFLCALQQVSLMSTLSNKFARALSSTASSCTDLEDAHLLNGVQIYLRCTFLHIFAPLFNK